MVEFNDALRHEYETLIAGARLRTSHITQIDAVLTRIFLTSNWQQYSDVSARTGIPAHVIAIIHSLEASGRFDRHLHNGDPLTSRTTHVPRNRPKAGSPPFSWVESAVDALREVDEWDDWSLEGICFVLERYNGFGYRKHHPHVKSPYLWSFTNIYTAGKYTSDGRWSDTAVSKQCGGMALLLRMIATGKIVETLPGTGGTDEAPGRPTPHQPAPDYPGKLLRRDVKAPAVRLVQERLTSLGVTEVGPVDGDYGERTEWAVSLFQARHEDSRGEPLEIDGVVGPMTWNSLFEIELDASEEPGGGEPESGLAKSTLDVAASQIGIIEQPRGSNRGPEVDDYMGSIDGSLRGQPWCMAFVYWCFDQASPGGAGPKVPKTASVWRSWELANEQGLSGEIDA